MGPITALVLDALQVRGIVMSGTGEGSDPSGNKALTSAEVQNKCPLQTSTSIRRLARRVPGHAGADHVVLFSWGRFPCAIDDNWRRMVGPHVIQLQVEDRCEDLNNLRDDLPQYYTLIIRMVPK